MSPIWFNRKFGIYWPAKWPGYVVIVLHIALMLVMLQSAQGHYYTWLQLGVALLPGYIWIGIITWLIARATTPVFSA